jgi:hypothetical protein
MFPLIFLQLCGPAAVLSRTFLHDLTAARRFKNFFVIHIRIFTIKIEKFQLRGNNLVTAGKFQLLHDRVPAQLRGNIGLHPYKTRGEMFVLYAYLSTHGTKLLVLLLKATVFTAKIFIETEKSY